MLDRDSWLVQSLSEIPELIKLVREDIDPLAAAQLTGMPRASSVAPAAPLQIDAADDLHELWSHFTHFVSMAEARTGECRPVAHRYYSHRVLSWPDEALGRLARVLVEYLTRCAFRITHDAFFDQYLDADQNLMKTLYRVKGRYGSRPNTAHIRVHHAAPVECPTCFTESVLPQYSATGVRGVHCTHCEDSWALDEWLKRGDEHDGRGRGNADVSRSGETGAPIG